MYYSVCVYICPCMWMVECAYAHIVIFIQDRRKKNKKQKTKKKTKTKTHTHMKRQRRERRRQRKTNMSESLYEFFAVTDVHGSVLSTLQLSSPHSFVSSLWPPSIIVMHMYRYSSANLQVWYYSATYVCSHDVTQLDPLHRILDITELQKCCRFVLFWACIVVFVIIVCIVNRCNKKKARVGFLPAGE